MRGRSTGLVGNTLAEATEFKNVGALYMAVGIIFIVGIGAWLLR